MHYVLRGLGIKKTRYTETQIIKVLKEVEGGRHVKEVCREYGISDATYYNCFFQPFFNALNLLTKNTDKALDRAFQGKSHNLFAIYLPGAHGH